MSLTVVSLFAGVGGIDLAAELAGMRTVLVCEKDEACRTVLAVRFPDAVIHPDVTELTADDLHAAGAVPGRTVLTAGWPCQGNSVAGARGGMGDARSGLWVHVARLLGEFRFAWFVGENVPGLLSVNDGRDFATVVGDLAELGYGFAWRILDARYFGVPQRRARVVIVGRAGDSGAAPAQVLLEPESRAGDSAPGGEAWPGAAGRVEVGAGITSGADLSNTHTHTRRRAHGGQRRQGLADRRGRGSSRASRRWEVAALTANGVGTCGADDNQAQAGHLIAFAWQAGGKVTSSGSFQDDGTTPTLPRSQTLAVSYAPDVAAPLTAGVAASPGVNAPGRRKEDDHNLIAYPLAVRGRDGGADLEAGEPGDPMFALRAGDGGSSRSQLVAVHENQRGEITTQDDTALNTGGGKPGQEYPAVTDGVIVRRLTPLECERLQGFPDEWTAVHGASDSARYRQLGNSVAVPVFEWVLSRLAAVDEALSGAAREAVQA